MGGTKRILIGLTQLMAATLFGDGSFAQEANFSLSTKPFTTAGGLREIAPMANISGIWESDSGARYACTQRGRGFVCVVEKVSEEQAGAGAKVGEVSITGVVYEHVAISNYAMRFSPPAAGHPPYCPPRYLQSASLNLRISDDSKIMRGEILSPHLDDSCTQDGATVQDVLFQRVEAK